jgi:outer membrane receptor protein involved in Fe transport
MDAMRNPSVGRAPTFSPAIVSLLACLAFAATPAFSQTKTSPTTPPANESGKTLTSSQVSQLSSSRPSTLDSETVVLSPFEVRSDEDTGYNATSTLMGTRLRSDLKDLAASISVATKDFMNDINATDLTSLFVYTLGTEVGGAGGNFSGLSDPAAGGDGNDALGQASPATRVRGLLSVDRTRDYFLSDIPMDGYNIDRVEISRGPNSMLFGLGSPAGIANQSIIKADLRRAKTTIGTKLDNYGTYRATLDTNQVLIKDKLALRVAGVYANTKYYQDFAFDRKKAGTLTGTWKPFKDTVIKVTTEYGRDDSNRPEQRPPTDNFTWWWQMGKPVWDPTTGTGHLTGTPDAAYTGSNLAITATGGRNGNVLSSVVDNFQGNTLGLVYSDPYSSKPGLDIGGGVIVDGMKGPPTNGLLNASGTALMNGAWASLASGLNQLKVTLKNPLGFTLYTRAPQMTDPSVFDFYRHSLEGPTKYEYAEWKAYNATIEQSFFDKRAGIQLEFDAQYLDSGYLSPVTYSLDLDINQKLWNGSPNPNFLRPYSAGSGFKRVNSNDREASRITGYYDLDLRHVKGPKWLGEILGRHMFNVNYTEQQSRLMLLAGTPINVGLDYVASEGQTLPGTISSTGRLAATLNYYGDSVANAATPQDAVIYGLQANHNPSGLPGATILYQQRPANTAPSSLAPWVTKSFSLVTESKEDGEPDARNGYSSKTKQDVHSGAAALQSQWLNNTIVTTVGVRRDSAWSFDAGLAPQSPAGNADIRPDVWRPRLTTVLSEDTSNWGVVARLPEFLRKRLPLDSEISLLYNSASNFRVAAQRYNILNQPIGPETGETKEYGMRLTTFGGKLDFKVVHYETTADKATVSGFVGPVGQLADYAANLIDQNYLGTNTSNPEGIAAFESWLNGPYGKIYQKTFHYTLTPNTDPNKPVATYGHYSDTQADRGQVAGTSAVKSTGLEFEMVFNPTRNWRIFASAGKADAVRTNIAPEFNDFINNPQNGVLALVQNPDTTATAAGRLLTTNPSVVSVASVIQQNVANLTDPIFRQSGTRTDELRRWHWSMVTNYNFNDNWFGGHLKGFSIGGGVRWMDKIAIGYPVTTFVNSSGATVPILDVFNPYFGPTETSYDANIGYTHKFHRFTWNARLYVQNIGVGNKLIPVYANPNGVTAVWRIASPETWTLSNTFTF